MPGDFGGPVCSCAFSLVGLAHETAGAPCARHSRAPFVFEGADPVTLEQTMLRDREPMSQCYCGPHVSTSLRGALATKQSTLASLLAARWIALLTLAMTLRESLKSAGWAKARSSRRAHRLVETKSVGTAQGRLCPPCAVSSPPPHTLKMVRPRINSTRKITTKT